MVAASRVQRARSDESNLQTHTPLRDNFYLDGRALCMSAEALRPRLNRNSNVEMNQYLLGPLSITSISQCIHHNNTNHLCNTVDQIGRLVVIMETRKVYGYHYNVSQVLGEVIDAVRRLEELETTRAPTGPCTFAHFDMAYFRTLPSTPWR